MADFEVSVAQWADQAGAKANRLPLAFALRMIERIKSYTPVLTGRLRASWQIISQTAEQILIGTNVEYARRIEYGFQGEDALGRVYHQHGAGMVTRAVSEADEVAKQALQDTGQ